MRLPCALKSREKAFVNSPVLFGWLGKDREKGELVVLKVDLQLVTTSTHGDQYDHEKYADMYGSVGVCTSIGFHSTFFHAEFTICDEQRNNSTKIFPTNMCFSDRR